MTDDKHGSGHGDAHGDSHGGGGGMSKFAKAMWGVGILIVLGFAGWFGMFGRDLESFMKSIASGTNALLQVPRFNAGVLLAFAAVIAIFMFAGSFKKK